MEADSDDKSQQGRIAGILGVEDGKKSYQARGD
jgi:hypothetical protein